LAETIRTLVGSTSLGVFKDEGNEQIELDGTVDTLLLSCTGVCMLVMAQPKISAWRSEGDGSAVTHCHMLTEYLAEILQR